MIVNNLSYENLKDVLIRDEIPQLIWSAKSSNTVQQVLYSEAYLYSSL